MNEARIRFQGQEIELMRSGALFWPSENLLVVSDLHLGKSERIARRGGALLPPYETDETLHALREDIALTQPATVMCLGDSFDDTEAAEALSEDHRAQIAILQAGRRWLWVEGNHDPGPVDVGGECHADLKIGPFMFRHIATAQGQGELSGHYHPKARIRGLVRPCFLVDEHRLMMPAYGHYTGGLWWTAPEIRSLFSDTACAYLTGKRVIAVPVPAEEKRRARGGMAAF